jgi:toxin secretion/phage lysis holin
MKKFIIGTAIGITVGEHNFPTAYGVLLGLMVLDVASGIVRSAIRGNVNSGSYRVGVLKKSLIVMTVAAGHVFALLTVYVPWLSNVDLPLGVAFAVAFCIGEMISILENIVESGVKVPRLVMDVTKLLEKSETDEIRRQ